MNNTEQTASIYVNNCEESNFRGKLKPGRGASFEVSMPEGEIPYIKLWCDGAIVLISHIKDYQIEVRE
jgi:hypothetical protein